VDLPTLGLPRMATVPATFRAALLVKDGALGSGMSDTGPLYSTGLEHLWLAHCAIALEALGREPTHSQRTTTLTPPSPSTITPLGLAPLGLRTGSNP